MRFPSVRRVSINDLKLDQKNYRFSSASDQSACVEKIYHHSPSNFSNMLSSLAEDDLGELLLVYKANEDTPLIVADGNRRAAALKVLFDPELAPTDQLKKKAEAHRQSTSFDFDNIMVQVSSDKELIFKTIYERHAAGKGVGQIDWNALANAKFRFDNKIEDQDWKAMALLMELAVIEDPIMEFADSGNYSHDVFRRIVRAAIQKNIIQDSLFSKTGMRINKSRKQLHATAIKHTKTFLEYMKDGKISLSRKGDSYADKAKIDEYLNRFVPPTQSKTETTSGAGTKANETNQSTSQDTKQGSSQEEEKKKIKIDNKKPARIESSDEIVERLNKLQSGKLSSLYSSLTSLYFSSHSALICIGAWAFFETISRGLGTKDGHSIEASFGNKISLWFPSSGKKKSMKQSIKFINDEGNCNKHDDVYYSVHAASLAVHFEVLEPLIIKALDELLEKKKQPQSGCK